MRGEIDRFETMDIKRIKFEKKIYAIDQKIAKRITDDKWRYEEIEIELDNALLRRLYNFMCYSRKDVKGKIKVPKTWKDHLKEHIALTSKNGIILWILGKMKPAEYNEIATMFEQHRYCPHLSSKSNEYHFEFLQFEPSRDRYGPTRKWE